MKVNLISIVIGALGILLKIFTKRQESLEISGQLETVQIPALLESARIPIKVLGTCCYVKKNLQV